METMSCCGRHFAAAVFVSKDETFWWGLGFKQNKTKEIQKNAESVRKCKTIKSNQKNNTHWQQHGSLASLLSMNNKNHCVRACVRQAKNVACVGRKGEQSQWLLMNVFSFSSFFPPKKPNKQNEEDDGWKLVCVSIGGRGTSDGHSLLSAQPYPRKRIPFGAVANGPGGRSKEDRRWHPTTDPGTINTHTHTKTGFLFSYCYKKKLCFVARIRAVCTCVFTN